MQVPIMGIMTLRRWFFIAIRKSMLSKSINRLFVKPRRLIFPTSTTLLFPDFLPVVEGIGRELLRLRGLSLGQNPQSPMRPVFAELLTEAKQDVWNRKIGNMQELDDMLTGSINFLKNYFFRTRQNTRRATIRIVPEFCMARFVTLTMVDQSTSTRPSAPSIS
jgi:hypothetical protein